VSDGFGGTQFDTGASGPYTFSFGTPAIGVTLDNPDPARDYIASGPGRFTPTVPQLLSSSFDDVTRQFGHRTYEAMLTDPAVYSSYLALKLSILNGPIKVLPALRPQGYRYKPPAVRGPQGSEPAKGGDPRNGAQPTLLGGKNAKLSLSTKPVTGGTGEKLDPEARRAIERAEFVEREQKRLKVSLKTTLLQMLDMMAFGNKLAEKTREEIPTGPDKGLLGIKAIKVKPHWAWKFVVNCYLDVEGILTFVPPVSAGGSLPDGSPAASSGGLIIVPRDKFVLFQWLPRDHDPRGTSALRAAYDWWNLKTQIKPHYYQYLTRFGTPSLDYKLAPNDNAPRMPINPDTKLPYPRGTPGILPVDSSTYAYQILQLFQNSYVLVRPDGSEFNLIEPNGDGQSFLNAFDLFDRQICLAIGLQTRASLEAEHGSKADSETAADTRGLVIAHGREYTGDLVGRELYYDSILLNFGEEDAELFTPECHVGDTEDQNQPEKWKAAASLGFQVGPSQLVEMDNDLDLPERDLEGDMAHATAMAEVAAKAKGNNEDKKPPAKGGE
jgi:hypothetical protein